MYLEDFKVKPFYGNLSLFSPLSTLFYIAIYSYTHFF